MVAWFRNVWLAVVTILRGLLVTLKTMGKTYNRKAFTQIYEYPEVPIKVKPRYRGFHRFDLTTCIGCEKCAQACPVDCIYIEKEKNSADKLQRLENIKIPNNFDYQKVHSISFEAREKLSKIQPGTISQASRISGVSPSDVSVLLVYMGR